jgi:hypothetical protein
MTPAADHTRSPQTPPVDVPARVQTLITAGFAAILVWLLIAFAMVPPVPGLPCEPQMPRGWPDPETCGACPTMCPRSCSLDDSGHCIDPQSDFGR